jgi:hypothetical protein
VGVQAAPHAGLAAELPAVKLNRWVSRGGMSDIEGTSRYIKNEGGL